MADEVVSFVPDGVPADPVTPVKYNAGYWDNLASQAESDVGLPKGLLLAIKNHGEKSNADQVSSAGAKTPFQIIPGTRDLFLKKYGVDAYADDASAAKVAALHLRESLDRGNSPEGAVREYHGGPDRSKWGATNESYGSRVMKGFGVGTASAAAPQVVGFEPDAAPAKASSSPTASDYGRAVMAGGASAVRGIGTLAEGVGLESAGKFLQDLGKSAEEYWQKGMTPAAVDAQSRKFLNDDLSIGDFNKHTVGLMLANSLLPMAAMAVPGGVAAKGLQAAGVSSGVAGAVGFGASEGAFSGAMDANQAYDQVQALPEDKLVASPFYQKAYWELPDTMPDAVRRATAREAVAKLVSTDTGLKAGLAVGLLSAPFGAVAGRAMKGVTGPGKALAEGLAVEPLSEAAQSAGEQVAQNSAIRNFADPTQTLSEGVANQTAGGAIAGLAMSGAPAVLSAVGRRGEPTEAQKAADAARVAELEAKAKGTPATKTKDDFGQDVELPGKPGEPLSPGEQAEVDLLKGKYQARPNDPLGVRLTSVMDQIKVPGFLAEVAKTDPQTKDELLHAAAIARNPKVSQMQREMALSGLEQRLRDIGNVLYRPNFQMGATPPVPGTSLTVPASTAVGPVIQPAPVDTAIPGEATRVTEELPAPAARAPLPAPESPSGRNVMVNDTDPQLTRPEQMGDREAAINAVQAAREHLADAPGVNDIVQGESGPTRRAREPSEQASADSPPPFQIRGKWPHDIGAGMLAIIAKKPRSIVERAVALAELDRRNPNRELDRAAHDARRNLWRLIVDAGGISEKEAADINIDPRSLGGYRMSGLVTSNGMRADVLARLFAEAGYLTPMQMEDRGGDEHARQLVADLLAREYVGKPEEKDLMAGLAARQPDEPTALQVEIATAEARHLVRQGVDVGAWLAQAGVPESTVTDMFGGQNEGTNEGAGESAAGLPEGTSAADADDGRGSGADSGASARAGAATGENDTQRGEQSRDQAGTGQGPERQPVGRVLGRPATDLTVGELRLAARGGNPAAREAAQAELDRRDVADYDDSVVASVVDDYAVEFDALTNMTDAAAMRALGFTEEEIADAEQVTERRKAGGPAVVQEGAREAGPDESGSPEGGGRADVDEAARGERKEDDRQRDQEGEAAVDVAAHEAATSPNNDLPQPTEAQAEAGNYKKGHVTISGLAISIENPEGSKRRPEWPTLKSHYGYFLATTGKDGDHVDVFIKPETPLDYSGPVYVIDQKTETGRFDEHKVMLGWQDPDAARAAYLENYTPGWDGIRSTVKFQNVEMFKDWLGTADLTKPSYETRGGALGAMESDASKVEPDASLDRSRPRQFMAFSKPYEGKTGAKLVGYEWAQRKEEYIDKRGENRVRRVSDWDQAVTNLQTGRDVVHQFHITTKDDEQHVVSAETAATMLGVSQSTVRTNAAKLLQQEIEAQKKGEAEAARVAELNAMESFSTPAAAVESRKSDGYIQRVVDRALSEGKGWGSSDNDYASREKYRFLTRGGKFIFSPEFVSDGSALHAAGWRTVEYQANEIWGRDGRDLKEKSARPEPPAKTDQEKAADKVEYAARELARVITEEAYTNDFAPSELPQVIANWAKDEGVPADDLRIEMLRHLDKFDVSEGRKKQIRDAVSPLKLAKPVSRETPNTEDAGAELTYNRRNRVKGGLQWSDLEGKNETLRVAETKKENVYPRPDYEKMVADGTPAMIAHLVKQVYDAISVGPVTRGAPTDENLKAYIGAVNRIMDGVMAWTRDNDAVSAWASKQARMAGAMLGRATEITSMVKTEGRTLLDFIYPDGWRSHRAELALVGGNKVLGALQPSYEEGRRAMKAVDGGWPSKQEAWQKRFDVRETEMRARNVPGPDPDGEPVKRWAVYAKNSRMYLAKNHPDGGFATEDEAKAWAREQAKRGAKTGISDKGISVEAARREGPARRMEGEDVSSDQLKETFGFKGVNFGTWMKGDSNKAERQLHLNHAYDAFMDLAEILEVPHRAMSLNGMLGIAFGAQGNGGGAAAHFVPGVNEINLTRTSGAGSLAHEFGHGLDHYFAVQAGLAGRKEPFLTEHYEAAGSGIRPEVVERFAAIVKAMNRKTETSDQVKLRLEAGRARSAKQVNGWLAAIKRDFMTAKVDEAAFDRLAERIRALDLGDGKVAAGSRNLSPVVDELRGLYKAKTGRTYSLDQIGGLQSNVDHLQYLKSDDAAARTHVPQQVTTDFATDAASLDKQKGGKAYWNTNLEKFARAFDAFVSESLAAKAAKNSYLSHAGREDETTPRGDERKAINAEFQALVDELRTKETDKGVMMFSRVRDELLGLRMKMNQQSNLLPNFHNDRIALVRPRTQENPTPGTTRVAYDILDIPQFKAAMKAGADRRASRIGATVGKVLVDVDADGRFVSFRNIEVDENKRNRGYGGAVVASMLATNPAGMDIEIYDILPEARAWWDARGVKRNYSEIDTVIGKLNTDRYVESREIHDPERFKRAGGTASKGAGSLRAGADPGAARSGRQVSGQSDDRSRARVVEVQRQLEPLLSRWRNAPPVRVVGDTEELPIAAKIREMGAEREIRGWFDGTTAWLVAGNLKTERATLEVLFHEALGHAGLRGMLGDQLDPVLREVYLLNESAIRQMVETDYSHLDLSKPVHRLMAAEEYLAHMAQREATDPAFKKVAKAIQRIIAMLRDFVRGLGVNLTLSDADLQGLIAKARRFVESGVSGDVAYGAAPAFSKAETAAPEAFSRSRVPDWVQGGSAALQSAASKIDTYAPDKPIREKIKALSVNWKERLVQGMVDQFAPLKRLDMDAYVAARMVKSADGVLEGTLMYGKPMMDKDGAIVGDLDGKGFLGAMQDLQGEHDRFFMWLAGNRAERLAGEGRENLFTPAEIADMKKVNQGRMRDGKSREIEYAKAAQVFREYNKAIMDLAERTGLIDGAARHLWEHDFYVPFYRIMDESGNLAGASQVKGLVRQKAFQKLKGGQENLGDLMENTLRNWSHLISASLANQAASKSLQAAEAAGVAIEAPEAAARQMAKSIGKRDGVVYYMDHGKERFMLVDDPFVLDAITSMEAASFKGLPMQLMSKFKHFLTLGVTASPTFKIRNLIRDSVSAIGQNDMSMSIGKNLVQGWGLTDKKSADYAQMLFGGALMRFGTSLEGDRAAHVKRLINAGVDDKTILNTPEKIKAAVGALWDSWADFGDRMENINRTALYKQLRDKGLSHRDAAFQARDMLDFSMQGSWVGMRFLTQIVPFLNARVQGLYKLGRAAKQDPKRLGYVTGAVALASVALLLAYQDDEDWKKREDWDRDAFWWLKIGDKAFRIPKPFEIGAVGTIAERSAEMIVSNEMTGKRFGERLRSMLLDTFAMNPIPQMFKPLIDLYANKDSFTGRDIETMGMERLSKSERKATNTSLVAQALGNDLVSPVQVDFLIRGYLGWLGSHAAMTVDLMAQPFSAVAKPERKVDDMFFVGDFVKDLPAGQSRYVEDFYKQAKAAAEVMADISHARQLGDVERAQAILEEKADKIKAGRPYTAVQRPMSILTSEIRRVEASRDLSAQEKRRQIDSLVTRRNDLAKQASERSRQALEPQ